MYNKITLKFISIIVMFSITGCSFVGVDKAPPRESWDTASPLTECTNSEALPILDGAGGGALLGWTIGSVIGAGVVPIVPLVASIPLLASAMVGSSRVEECKEFKTYKKLQADVDKKDDNTNKKSYKDNQSLREQLKELEQLKDDNVITEEEYIEMRQKLLMSH